MPLAKSLRVHFIERAGFIHLVFGDELLGQQGLEPMQVTVGIDPLGPRPLDALLCIGYIGLSACDIRLRDIHGADQRVDPALFVRDLSFQSGLIRDGPFEGIAIRAFINLEDQIAFFHEIVVANIQVNDGPFDLRRDADLPQVGYPASEKRNRS